MWIISSIGKYSTPSSFYRIPDLLAGNWTNYQQRYFEVSIKTFYFGFFSHWHILSLLRNLFTLSSSIHVGNLRFLFSFTVTLFFLRILDKLTTSILIIFHRSQFYAKSTDRLIVFRKTWVEARRCFKHLHWDTVQSVEWRTFFKLHPSREKSLLTSFRKKLSIELSLERKSSSKYVLDFPSTFHPIRGASDAKASLAPRIGWNYTTALHSVYRLERAFSVFLSNFEYLVASDFPQDCVISSSRSVSSSFSFLDLNFPKLM